MRIIILHDRKIKTKVKSDERFVTINECVYSRHSRQSVWMYVCTNILKRPGTVVLTHVYYQAIIKPFILEIRTYRASPRNGLSIEKSINFTVQEIRIVMKSESSSPLRKNAVIRPYPGLFKPSSYPHRSFI
jgi:hypothetical protein